MQKLNFEKQLKQIQEFQKEFGFTKQKFGHPKTMLLRQELILEENKETNNGIKDYHLYFDGSNINDPNVIKSLVEIADGLVDTTYVILGSIESFDEPDFTLDLEKAKIVLAQLNNSNPFSVDYILNNYLINDNVYTYPISLNCMLLYIEETWNKYLPNVSFEEVYDEVHRSNMSKRCRNIEVAQLTMKKYKEEYNVNDFTTRIDENSGEIYLHRASDNKLLKSIEYTPADVKTIILKTIK